MCFVDRSIVQWTNGDYGENARPNAAVEPKSESETWKLEQIMEEILALTTKRLSNVTLIRVMRIANSQPRFLNGQAVPEHVAVDSSFRPKPSLNPQEEPELALDNTKQLDIKLKHAIRTCNVQLDLYAPPNRCGFRRNLSII